jgi:hypothetical protein
MKQLDFLSNPYTGGLFTTVSRKNIPVLFLVILLGIALMLRNLEIDIHMHI